MGWSKNGEVITEGNKVTVEIFRRIMALLNNGMNLNMGAQSPRSNLSAESATPNYWAIRLKLQRFRWDGGGLSPTIPPKMGTSKGETAL
jgi:hypothetical protein